GLYVGCLLAAAGREVTVLDARDDAASGRTTHGRSTNGRSTNGRSTDGRSTDDRPTDDGPTTSRSIGIHPPALEALEIVGVADEMINLGSRIRTARLLLGAEHIGDLSLASCPPPYPFVLTLPQH